MELDLAKLFLNANFLCLLIIGFIYFVLDRKPLWQMTALLIVVDAFSRIIHAPLLQIDNIRFVWYLIWASLNLLSLYIVVKTTREYPTLQRITIPIGFLIIIGSFVVIARHFERNVTSTDYFKDIYTVSGTAVSWIIIAYLFAPIALLLVKSIRGRISAKH